MSQTQTEAAPPQTEKTVRFLRSYASWNRDVEAGFAVARADELIARGIAVEVRPIHREPLGGRVVRKG